MAYSRCMPCCLYHEQLLSDSSVSTTAGPWIIDAMLNFAKLLSCRMIALSDLQQSCALAHTAHVVTPCAGVQVVTLPMNLYTACFRKRGSLYSSLAKHHMLYSPLAEHVMLSIEAMLPVAASANDTGCSY